MKNLHILLAVALLSRLAPAHAETIDIDWSQPMKPEQISLAKDVAIDADSDPWTTLDSKMVWTREIIVPGAASISFAAEAALPEGARLIAGNPLATREYRADAISAGRLYGIPLPGNTLSLRLEVPAAQREQLHFKLVGIYAGPPSVQSKAIGDTSLRNLYCAIDTLNPIASRSTVEVLVSLASGQTACTGTLVANARGDFAHNIITAAHCGADASYDASRITVLWNRETNCANGNIAAASVTGPSSTGYTSIKVVTQVKDPTNANVAGGDTWLFGSTSAPPDGANPYWSALDATEPAADYAAQITGLGPVFAVSHPLALTKTYARSTNPVKNGDFCFGDYDCISSYAVVWNDGRVDSGSSGGALRNQNGEMIGNLAACTTDNLSCFYPKLSTAWTGDGTSGAGLKPFLDSSNTGSRKIAGYENPSRSDNLTVMFASDVKNANNSTVMLTAFIDDATSCTAAATPSVSGFPSGAFTFSNGQKRDFAVTVSAQQTTFTINCVNAAGTGKETSIVINPGNNIGAPTVTLNASAATATVGSSVTLSWSSSDAASCVASGNWSGSKAINGSQSVTIGSVGNNSYSLSCSNSAGTTTRTASISGTQSKPPSISIYSATADHAEVGSSVTLSWTTFDASTCSASGSWSGSKATSGSENVVIGASGANSYTLTCSSDSGSVSRSLTVTGTQDSGGSSSSGSGGGASGDTTLLGLLGMALLRRRRAALRARR